MNDRVSVIVPVYNGETFLRTCVDSIIGQTYENIEILLADDGSLDHCPTICDEYAAKDARVRVLHLPHGGVSAARNAGIDAAQGEWLAFVDNDDWIEPDMIQTMREACEQFETDLSFCRVIIAGEKTTYRGKNEPPRVYTTEEILTEILMHRSCGVNVVNKLFRASLFEGIRFPLNERYEDETVIYPLFRQVKTVAYSGRGSYVYRIHEDSYCRSDFTFERVELKRKHRKQLEEELRKEFPQLLPLMKYHAAYSDFEMMRARYVYGGELQKEEEKDLRDSFENSFPYMLEMWAPGQRNRQDAIRIRLGLWDLFPQEERKMEERYRKLPEGIREQFDPGKDAFLQQLFHPEQWGNMESDLKRLKQAQEKLRNMEKEKKDEAKSKERMQEQIQQLTEQNRMLEAEKKSLAADKQKLQEELKQKSGLRTVLDRVRNRRE